MSPPCWQRNPHRHDTPTGHPCNHGASNPAFTLPDANTRALYAAKYQETSSLYHAGQVPFEAILARIQQHIDLL